MRAVGRVILLFAIVLSAAVLSGCKTSSLISESQEIEIGRQASLDIERKYHVVNDPALNQRINHIGQTIAARSARANIAYTFKILDLKDVNAVSLPGGWVYLYKGLINECKDDDDMLAGVIAHEIGHVAARHHAAIMGRETLYGIGIQVLVKGNLQQWVAVWANLDLLRWSRSDENEADRLAINYTYGSPWKPDGLIRFLKILQTKSKGDGGIFGPMLRTHPLTKERIERAEKYLQELERTGGKTSG